MLLQWVKMIIWNCLFWPHFTLLIARYRLDKYPLIRQTLRDLSLINEKPDMESCGQEWTKSWKCNIWGNTHFCTIQDPLTDVRKQVMKTPYKKAHRIGGTLPVCEKSLY